MVSFSFHSRVRRLTAATAFALALICGCSELVHEGHVSDSHTSSPIPDVEVLRATSGGPWTRIGRTDGRGAWWILKSEIKGGSRIRLSKPGYHHHNMTDGDFLGSRSHLMTPTSDALDAMDAANDPYEGEDPFGDAMPRE